MENKFKFYISLFLIGSFFIVELIYGIVLGSLTLQADAFHMLADFLATLITHITDKMSLKSKDVIYTFGWNRIKIIGSTINGIFLISLCFVIFLKSIQQFFYIDDFKDSLGDDIDILIYIAIGGLIINLITLFLFGFNDNDLNIYAMILHVFGDIMASIIVIISGIIIKYSDHDIKYYCDPILSLLIAFIIVLTTIPMIKKSLKILMERVPDDFNYDKLLNDIHKVDNLNRIDELHIWNLDEKTLIGSIKVNFNQDFNINNKINEIEEIFKKNNINDVTIQASINSNIKYAIL